MSQIAVRVDDDLKKEATAIFNELGLDMSTAVKLFLGTIYQFTLDTIYSAYENIKKGDFQAEIVF